MFLLTGYDITRALQEQSSIHQKQEQRNSYQTDQLTFRDAHLDITYSNNLFIVAIIIMRFETLNTQAWIHLYSCSSYNII